MVQGTPTAGLDGPNAVVLQLSTAITIPDYSRYYHTPIAEFRRPSYHALPEGSLITTPYILDLRSANLSLLLSGVLLGLFIRNVVVSGNYLLRITDVKRKLLFWILFASQLLAPLAFIPIIWSHFDEFIDCTIAYMVMEITTVISLSLLVTGILGTKAYRCLDKTPVVLYVVGVCQLALTVISALDVYTLRGERRLTGSCIRAPGISFVSPWIVIQFLESLFIAGCYSWAVWKSRGRPDVRGRISISLSLDDLPNSPRTDSNRETGGEQGRRGWWDYAPKSELSPQSPTPAPGIVGKVLGLWFPPDAEEQFVSPRKPSTPGDVPLPQPMRASSVRISEASGQHLDPTSITRRRFGSPVPSSAPSRLSRLMPRMTLFKEVLRDELVYTTVIAACSTLVAVLTLVGTNLEVLFSIQGWVALNWTVISLLSVHSFGRVTQRHERETLLRHPSSWDINKGRVNTRTTTESTQGHNRRPWSPVSVASHPRRGEDSLSPLGGPAHTRFAGSMSSWNSMGYANSASGSTASILHSPAPTLHSCMRVLPSDPNIPVVLPSPRTDHFDYPLTGANRTTPTPSIRTSTLPVDVEIPDTYHSRYSPSEIWDGGPSLEGQPRI